MSEDKAWLKRQAVQVVAQLPDDPADALAILAFAQELVTGFLADHPPPRLALAPALSGDVLTFPKASANSA